MKTKITQILSTIALVSLIAVPTAIASTGNEVAIETIEFFSPLSPGIWVFGAKVPTCKYTDKTSGEIKYAYATKTNHSLLFTQPGERCAVNTQNGNIVPFFMGTSMATPALK